MRVQAANVLEWDRVLAILAKQAHSSMGAERCRDLILETELEAADRRQQETTEMVRLDETGYPFPAPAFQDLREAFKRVTKGAVLEGHELRDCSRMLGVAAEVRRYLVQHHEAAPALAERGADLDEHPWVKSAIDRCIDEEGSLLYSATPELRRLHQQAQDLKQRMRHRLDRILASSQYADLLQEQFFALRENRYVIPIKAGMQHKVRGIVHDVSASGATVFVEPRELVDLNNAIKVADLEISREARRILQDLSRMVAEHAHGLDQNLHTLAELDCIAAKARFSHLIQGRPVTLNPSGRVVLRQARHPLLVLAREHVVANDISLDESVRALVISGPNTGGKTVTLKIMGLTAFMVRSGILPPCGDDSEMALFTDVYADIGDTQDLTKDLSSFSAHLTKIIALLEQTADVQSPSQVLVLLDEIVTATDPAEGAALAEAVLLRLSRLGLKVVVTTHYNALKVLAQSTPGFMNASMEFDVSTLSPTYRLIMGIPGGSSAIDIAGRLGMDEEILEEALKRVKREDLVLDQVLADLHDKQHRLEAELERAHADRVKLERAAEEARDVANRLQQSEREERKRTRKKLTEELLRARAQIQEVLESVKREQTAAKAREAKARLADVEREATIQQRADADTVPLDRLTVGDPVEITSLGTQGILLEAPQGKKRVRLRVRDTEMSVATSLLVGRVPEAAEGERPAGQPKASSSVTHISSTSGSFGSGASRVLDLRGQTADEALEHTVAMLDEAVLAGAPCLRIIHGHGTGKLKTTIRDYLKSSSYVKAFRPGERAEGGDGVTIAEL